MGPDIEWQVGDEAGQHTIVKTPPKPPRRWQKIAVALTIVFGVGLGVIYASIPEPSKPPVPPTLAPTPTPPPLEATIDQESQALASGDLSAFMAVQDKYDSEWYLSQRESFQGWGTAPSGNQLYAVVASGTLPSGRAWVDIRQWRSRYVYFRQTRFYQLRDNRWLRTRPDFSFWSGNQRTGQTAHFALNYPQEDAPIARITADRFERAYVALCADLSCQVSPQRALPRVMTITLILKPATQYTTVDQGQLLTITLPSPRLTGIYERWGIQNDPMEDIAYDSLLVPVARIASGNVGRWFTNNDGELFFQSIVAWERLRLKSASDSFGEIFVVTPAGRLSRRPHPGDNAQLQQFYIDLLSGGKLLPLKSLWHWPLNVPPDSNMLHLIRTETDAAVAFIEKEFGPEGVGRFLNGLGTATSLPEVIEGSLGQKYQEFEQRWLAWTGH